MKFLNFVKYRDQDRIASARRAHFAYADRLREQGNLSVGGPLLDDGGRRIGLLFIYEAESGSAALTLAQQDPFTLAEALSSYEVTEWRLRGVNIDLLAKANRSGDRVAPAGAQVRLFANYAKYAPEKAQLDRARPAHWAYDRILKGAGNLALAGPFASDQGGLFVYRAADKEEAMSYARLDPFAVEGVVAQAEVLEWVVEGVRTELLTPDFADSA